MPSQVGYETADIGHEATGAPSAGGKSTLLVVVSAVSNCRQTVYSANATWRDNAVSHALKDLHAFGVEDEAARRDVVISI